MQARGQGTIPTTPSTGSGEGGGGGLQVEKFSRPNILSASVIFWLPLHDQVQLCTCVGGYLHPPDGGASLGGGGGAVLRQRREAMASRLGV